MRRLLTAAASAALLAGLTAGPAAATTARAAAACPPGTTNTTYCEVITITPHISQVAGQKLLKALKQGLKVSVSCNEACTMTITVTLPGKAAHQLHLARAATLPRFVVVARGKTTFTAAGKKVVKVKFTKKAKKALAKAKKVKLTLNATAVDSVGNKGSAHSVGVLKR